MGAIQQLAAEAWRDYEVDGVPASGAHVVDKADLRALAQVIDSGLSAMALAVAAAAGPMTFAATQIELFNIVAPAVNALGVVYGDSAANNGFYLKSGAAGAPGWTYTGAGPGGPPGPVGPQGPSAGTGGLITAAAKQLAAGQRYGLKTSLADLAPVLPQLAQVQPGDIVEVWDADYEAATNPWTIHAFAGDSIVFQAQAPAASFALNVNGVRATFLSNQTYWRASYVVA